MAEPTLQKTFDFAQAESRVYSLWEQSGAFKPSGQGNPYTVVIPPPNVTGSLHMGHALNNTLQDILIRFERMRGKSVLWQPGMDHAGIATQMVVERQMKEEGAPKRTDMGREAFVEKVWNWKEQSGGTIINQLKRLGASCDWSRERFTMDEGLSKAVRKVFVQLYRDQLIYRDKRLVNWDPKFQTAISDLEVVNEERDGHFWHFKYPLENGETYEYVEKDEDGTVTLKETRNYISIATTRPETMLGDGAVAVHPSDARYKPIVGKRVLLPLADRYIPIIEDDHPDPDFGSGAVKITGAHDFNDYQVARRHHLPMHVILDAQARMLASDIMPEKYVGLDRFEARKQVIADIDAAGLLEKVEDKKVNQPIGDRSGVVIEPMLTDQWYVNAEELAKPAIAAVKDGRTRFIPENWSKTYFQWMDNIEPWCISRQLWWGHRIPAWYGPKLNGDAYDPEAHEIFVAETEAEAMEIAAAYYHEKPKIAETREAFLALKANGKREPVLYREEDVLDTWFSSALWPFSTLGWPEKTDALAAHYPTSTLVTAFDIIFFWVARMMMQGLHFMDEVPFRDVYIHALILDEEGQKMSKSKGNAIDPLTLVDQYGADALRFTLAALAAQGRNIRMSESRVEGYRNFGTKLWNASRFAQMNECQYTPDYDPTALHDVINQWIVHETASCVYTVTEALEAYRFNDAAGAAYRFVWNVFCDWYLEFAKPLFMGDDENRKTETRQTTAWVLDHILRILHPFMPFMTEELWANLAPRDGHLITAQWPTPAPSHKNASAAAELDWVIGLISAVRTARAEINVPAGAKIPMIIIGDNPTAMRFFDSHGDRISKLARLKSVETAESVPAGAAQIVHSGSVFALPLVGVIDIAAETARLDKELGKVTSEIQAIDKRLGNEAFVAKAPEAVVTETRTRREGFEAQREKLTGARKRLDDLVG
ncbi:MAG: valine--tRNA ligase [Pseudomonadota bacterium]